MAETAKIVNPDKIVVLPDADAGCSLEQTCPGPQLEAFLKANADKELLRHRLHQLLGGSEGAQRLHLHQRQRGEDRRSRAEGPARSFSCPTRTSARGSWSRPAARWTCGRAIATSTSSSPATASTRIKARVSRRPGRRPPRMHPGGAAARRRSLLDREDGRLLPEQPRATTSSSSPRAACCTACEREVPGKNFIPGPTGHCACADCRYMKMNTLEKLHDCLLNLQPRVELPEDIRKRAEVPMLRMLELSR